jgi:predicted transposase YbfD/YdcC
MEGSALEALRESAGRIDDPRVSGRTDHLLTDIVGISVLGTLCGADDWLAVETFAKARHPWLRQFFALPAGVPSHDTFGRVMGLINPKQLSACLVNWTGALRTTLAGRVIAIDGKTARGSASKTKGLKALHMVSAWACEAGLTLGQVAVDEKSNEITAIPELLELLDLQGAVVTLDAMGMQHQIVQGIRGKGADYVIGLKDNQPTLAADMRELADRGCEADFAGLTTDVYSTSEMARGGIEERDVRVIEIPENCPHRSRWPDLRTLAIVIRRTEREGVESYETRMYLSSLPPKAKLLSQAIRSHWGIENSLHWSMDVTFREDHHRLLDRNGVQNFSAIRRLVVSILRQDKSVRLGAKNKRLKAALDPGYALTVLENATI